MSNPKLYGMKNRNPDRAGTTERPSPTDIVEALMQPPFIDAFRAIENKLNTPFVNIPKNARSIDIRRLADVSPGTDRDLFLNYSPPKNHEAIITGYAIFSDALLAAQTEFIPQIDGRRVLEYHGTPTNLADPNVLPYRISLGVAPDLSDISIIECSLRITFEQSFTWRLTNLAATAQTMGVRFKGYIRPITDDTSFRVGG